MTGMWFAGCVVVVVVVLVVDVLLVDWQNNENW